jgi:hypothetical protein
LMSPYEGHAPEDWPEITRRLVTEYPLSFGEIEELAIEAWRVLWETRIGEGEAAIRLDEFDVPSMVAGFLFEKLLARALESRYPEQWRGGQAKHEKDLVHLADPRFSTEVKTSGQLGDKVYGNRSYNQ